MKESEAWRILAEEHDAGRTTTPYLCDALIPLPTDRIAMRIPLEMRRTMRVRIVHALNGAFTAYPDIDKDLRGVLHPTNSPGEPRDARVLACLMFSEQAKDEERSK